MNWSVQSEKIKKEEVEKVRVNYLINENISKQFKDLCNRKGWIMSAVIEHSIKRQLGI